MTDRPSQSGLPKRARLYKERTAAHYSTVAARYDRVGPEVLAYFGRWLVEEIPPLPAAVRALDVATGTGSVALALALALAQRGEQGAVTGVDLAEGMIAQARARAAAEGLPDLTFAVMDAEALSFPDASFDVVCCAFGTPHFHDGRRALAEMARVLQPGGTLALLVWDDPPPDEADALFLRALRERYGATDGEEAHGLSTPAILRSLRRLGLRAAATRRKQHLFWYADAGEWFAASFEMSRRGAGLLATLPPEARDAYRREVIAYIAGRVQQPRGVPSERGALAIIARRTARKDDDGY